MTPPAAPASSGRDRAHSDTYRFLPGWILDAMGLGFGLCQSRRAATATPPWSWWRSTRSFRSSAYSLLGYFYITLLPKWLGLHSEAFDIGRWPVARTVLIFLGIALAAANNIDPAIAVAIGMFGPATRIHAVITLRATSGKALAGVGPLIEAPVLVAVVDVSVWLRQCFPELAQTSRPAIADLATERS